MSLHRAPGMTFASSLVVLAHRRTRVRLFVASEVEELILVSVALVWVETSLRMYDLRVLDEN